LTRFSRAIRRAGTLLAVRIIAALSLSFVAVSCQLPNVFAPGNPVDFCVEQAKDYCALEFRCCTAAERAADPLHIWSGPSTERWAPSNEGDCVGLVADICHATVDQQNESLAKERIKYSADDAQSCLDSLAKSVDECKLEDFLKDDGNYLINLIQSGSPGIFGSECEDAIRGNVDPHDTCFAQYECKDGACTIPESGAATPVITDKGECDGTGRPTNPFQSANVDIQICAGPGNGNGG
jgi:hypothetical protein